MEGLSQLPKFSQELALQERGVWAHIHFSSLGVLHQEDEPPEHLALKTSRAHVWESQRAVGNKDSPLKGCAQNLTCSECRVEAVI